MLIISRSDVSYIVPLGVACTNIAIFNCFKSYSKKRQSQQNALIGAVVIIVGIVIMNLK